MYIWQECFSIIVQIWSRIHCENCFSLLTKKTPQPVFKLGTFLLLGDHSTIWAISAVSLIWLVSFENNSKIFLVTKEFLFKISPYDKITIIKFIFRCLNSMKNTFCHMQKFIWQMLKGPSLKSLSINISVFQDKPDRGA